jgi:lipopolysaccharide export LptBFGC system permease protein LptF
VLRIHRAILGELAATLALALVVVSSVLFAGLVLQTMGRTQGLEFRYLLTLLPPLLPVALAFGMPYAFLLSVALVYGRMAADRELVALRISGVAPRAIAAPALALGAVLSLLGVGFNGWVLPDAAQALRIQQRNLVDLFLGQLGGSDRTIVLRRCRFSFESYEPAERPGGTGVFRDFELDLRGADGALVQKLFGEEARLRRVDDELHVEAPSANLIFETPSGRVEARRGPARVDVGHVERLGLAVSFNEIVGMDRFEAKAKDVTLPDLAYLGERGDTPLVPLLRTEVELHGRLAGAFAPLVFGLAAAAVCLLVPARGRRLTAILLALAPVLVVHFPLQVAGKSLATSRQVPAWAGMWGANLVLLIASAALLRRAASR